ncbi:hypothetical protein ElyMa_005118700 [Elysia marginata]|uniref:Uncharacterized protein n=1 Tax=Elysia marginata TaxID=1093978 RepID=A0AAV4JJ44_9GAST|nr:hypothetical protein ElyMa_005118700 [Elysia marginata]
MIEPRRCNVNCPYPKTRITLLDKRRSHFSKNKDHTSRYTTITPLQKRGSHFSINDDHTSPKTTITPLHELLADAMPCMQELAENNKRPWDRPITTLQVTLNNDLKHVPGEKMTLTSQEDLDLIRDIAEKRDKWRTFIADIRRGAAEAVRPNDHTSERL